MTHLDGAIDRGNVEMSRSAPPVVLVSGDFVKTGGMDRANFALASYLARSGREVHVVAHRVDDELLAMPNVRLRRVVKPLDSYLLGSPLLDRAGRRVAGELASRGARVIVNGGNCRWPDVNWVHYVHAAWDPGAQSGLWPLPCVKAAVERRLELARERAAVKGARLLIANSRRTADDLTRHLGVPADRIRVVYYGVCGAEFRPAGPDERRATRARLNWDQQRPVVAFVGALGDGRKGFDVVLAAWEKRCALGPWDVDLAVIGAGAHLSTWRERVRAKRWPSSAVHFLGFRQDVPEVLRACDALVAPSRYEAYGLAAHEAICCGLPALVSARAGVAERYPAELSDLLLPDAEDADDLAARLERWYANRS